MKKLCILIVMAFLSLNLSAQTVDINNVLEFKNAAFDFGKITYGKPVKYTLEVKNIGSDSITLENVQVGCGCTTPEYEKNKRFASGETIKITLGFNGGTQGAFSKSATLFFSGGLQKAVTFKGETFTVPETPAPANANVQKMKP